MNPLAQMNQAMEYLEEHLTEEIDFEQMSRIAGCSEYHFRRMVSYLAGMSLGEYLRNRKLALAVSMLQNGQKVIDCAVNLGYNSPDAFSKAFQAMHGITPSQAKRKGSAVKSFPPMAFQLTIQGGDKMDYRIVHKEAFTIVGFKKRITLQYRGINPQMDSLNEKLTPAIVMELKSLCNTEPKGILSVSANFENQTEEGTELDQYVAVATTDKAPDGYDTLEVKASDWAVFTSVGPFPDTLQNTWARIYSEWLASSDYQLVEGPGMLWYDSPDFTRPDVKNEIWIAIEKK